MYYKEGTSSEQLDSIVRRDLKPLHPWHHNSWFLFDLYRCVVFVLLVFFMTSSSPSKTRFSSFFYCVFDVGNSTSLCLTKVSHLAMCGIFSFVYSQDFHFQLCSSRSYLSNKIGFISIGIFMQKLSQFFVGVHIQGNTKVVYNENLCMGINIEQISNKEIVCNGLEGRKFFPYQCQYGSNLCVCIEACRRIVYSRGSAQILYGRSYMGLF